MSSENTEQEPVTFVDKRKIDPETGTAREGDAVPEPFAGTGTAPQPDSVEEG
ncbi:MAG: nucleotide exchange factor GrpE, partial [Rhodococcus sp. (in: high G+C Gram-positive bacteria)]